jgi:hypothetical protein
LMVTMSFCTACISSLSSKISPCQGVSFLSISRLGNLGLDHYVKTSNRSHNICNEPLTPVTCTHICNGCYLVPVTDKRGRPTPGLASATPVTNVDFW